MDRCSEALFEEDLLDEYLSTLYNYMSLVFQHPLFKEARKEDTDLPFMMLYAAQRQVCSSEDESVYMVLRAVFGLMGYFNLLHVLSFILN